MWAAFLSNFCDNNEKYTHLDIAGPALNSYEPVWYMNKWNTGFWVDSLSSLFKELK
jgi:leucyl aminopeptidase